MLGDGFEDGLGHFVEFSGKTVGDHETLLFPFENSDSVEKSQMSGCRPEGKFDRLGNRANCRLPSLFEVKDNSQTAAIGEGFHLLLDFVHSHTLSKSRIRVYNPYIRIRANRYIRIGGFRD